MVFWQNRVSLVVTIVGLLFSVGMIISFISQSSTIRDLKKEQEVTYNEMITLQGNVSTKKEAYDKAKNSMTVKVTGFNPAQIEKDAKIVEDFFKPAFSWKSGDEYENTRQSYMKSLGKNNTFTTTYLPRDVQLNLKKGKTWGIDVRGMKSSFEEIRIAPLTAKGNAVRYAGFVKYFVYTDENTLAHKDNLNFSTAIIKFTVSGDADNRKVSEVEAWAGFSSE